MREPAWCLCVCLTECDSCGQTLLKDLEKLDDELVQLKVHLDSINSSSEAHQRLKELEKAIAEAKVGVFSLFIYL